MPRFLPIFLLIISLIHISIETTFFAYSTRVTCRRTDLNQGWCYRMDFLEQDVFGTDDFLGSLPLSCQISENHESNFVGSQDDDELGKLSYDPYINIYHNCNEEHAMKKVRIVLRPVNITEVNHSGHVNIDVTNRS